MPQSNLTRAVEHMFSDRADGILEITESDYDLLVRLIDAWEDFRVLGPGRLEEQDLIQTIEDARTAVLKNEDRNLV